MRDISKGWVGVLLGLLMVSVPAVPEPLKPEKNVTSPSQSPAFVQQFGLGFTILPARFLWDVNVQKNFYLGGGLVDFLFRVHPRVTVELSLGAIGTTHGPGKYQPVDPFYYGYYYARYGEISVATSVRCYLRKTPVEAHPFFLAPYVVGGLGLQVAFASFTTGPASNIYLRSLDLGGQLGIGLEFRLKSKYVFHVDARGIVRGNALADDSISSTDIGLQVGAGFAYFF